MYIHTVKDGESLYDIAKKYGVSATKIIENNGIDGADILPVGRKLLILTPTKTYTVRGGDTLHSISDRFGVPEGLIRAQNPKLWAEDLTHAEQVISIKHDTPKHSGIFYNGYYYRGASEESFKAALLLSDYITVSACTVKGDDIVPVFDDKTVVKRIRQGGIVPYLRIYRGGRPLNEEISRNAVSRASSLGYLGICTDVYGTGECEWLRILADIAHDEGLLLSCECDRANEYVDSTADHTVLFYDKLDRSPMPTFKDGEERFMHDFSNRCDPTRTFMDLPSLAYTEYGSIAQKDAIKGAARASRRIEYDSECMVMSYEAKRCRGKSVEDMTVKFESAENIKARLELASELGFMGISFDIMRVPTEYLLMAKALFAPLNYSEI